MLGTLLLSSKMETARNKNASCSLLSIKERVREPVGPHYLNTLTRDKKVASMEDQQIKEVTTLCKEVHLHEAVSSLKSSTTTLTTTKATSTIVAVATEEGTTQMKRQSLLM